MKGFGNVLSVAHCRDKDLAVRHLQRFDSDDEYLLATLHLPHSRHRVLRIPSSINLPPRQNERRSDRDHWLNHLKVGHQDYHLDRSSCHTNRTIHRIYRT